MVIIVSGGITKIHLDSSLITRKNGKINIHLINTVSGKPLFHKYDFLIITDNKTKEDRFYRVDDPELFSYDEETNVLTIISDEVQASLHDFYHVTAMEIEDAPIVHLLTQLMMNPNFYIQQVMNFSELLYTPTEEEYDEYSKVLGTAAVESLKQNKDIRFIDLTDYEVTDSDILFVNGLSYSLVDKDHFMLFHTTNETGIDKRILIIYNFELDKIDIVHLSRLTRSVNAFDLDEDDGNDSAYRFDKYVYLTSNSSFGHWHFKSDEIPVSDEDLVNEEIYSLDSSSRMINEEPLTDRIEEYDDCESGYFDNPYEYNEKSIKQTRYSVVSHKLGKTPNFVNIVPFTNDIDSNEGTFIGNIWWTVDDENIYVYNDGTSTCEFKWFAIYDENCKTETLNYEETVIFEKDKHILYNLNHDVTTRPEYYGVDYIQYNDDSRELTVYNTNRNNNPYGCKISYITGSFIANKKFLEYANGFTYNQDGYFDRNVDVHPSGTKVLNYSGEFRATKSRVYGDGLVQYLPINNFDVFNAGDIVAYVDGKCKLANYENYNTVVGVVVNEGDAALAIDTYTSSKVPVAMFGIHYVKVIGEINAGDKLCLVTDTEDKGVARVADSDDTCYIGKALEAYNNIEEVGTIKVLLGIS